MISAERNIRSPTSDSVFGHIYLTSDCFVPSFIPCYFAKSYKVELSGNSQIYGHTIIHVSEIAPANGLTLNNHFMIRLYYDSFSEAIGGLRIDEVWIGDIDPSKIGISYIYLPTISK